MSTTSLCSTMTQRCSTIGGSASRVFWKADDFVCTLVKPLSRKRTRRPSSSAMCCYPDTVVCRRRMCAASATGCEVCGIAGVPAPCLKRRCGSASGPGSPMRRTPTVGGCGMRSFATGCSIPRAIPPSLHQCRNPVLPWLPVVRRSLAVPLSQACSARRFLEQQTEEPPFGEPQQERNRQPEQQQRVPRFPYAPEPEPSRSRSRRVREKGVQERP